MFRHKNYEIGTKVQHRNGYIQVKYVDEKGEVTWTAESRRVWELQRGDLEDGDRVFHIDGDRTNNRIGNLAKVHFNSTKFIFLKQSRVLYTPKQKKETAMKAMIVAVSIGILSAPVFAVAKADSQVKESTFYVYSDKMAKVNHYAPSGWMGDWGDIKLNDADTEKPADGRTSTKVQYVAKGAQGANWAGIFWQQPPNNWGDKPGGYDLTGMKRLTFMARGAVGGEKIAEFKVGGITGEHGDSDAQSIGPIELTKDWKKYTIDLADKDMHHIIGAFCWSASKDDNPNGFTMNLDEIRFEK